jgi:hypothetical protein
VGTSVGLIDSVEVAAVVGETGTEVKVGSGVDGVTAASFVSVGAAAMAVDADDDSSAAAAWVGVGERTITSVAVGEGVTPGI